MNLLQISDENLYKLCCEYGARALEWRRKFIGLLPEVNRRRLFQARGFFSIFEFGAKLCGLSEEQVKRALSLDKRFEELPTLRALLVNGEESINKLARVASIATPQNEAELAQQIKVLPKSAVETLVRDEKFVPGHKDIKQNFDEASTRVRLSEEVKTKLLELQAKGIDINGLILEMLDARENKIEEEKEKIAGEIQENPGAVKRYIPARIRKILKQEHGERCSISTCKKPAKEIHHTQRFSLGKNHDPRYLAPLCHEHHVIAHSIDLKYRTARAGIG